MSTPDKSEESMTEPHVRFPAAPCTRDPSGTCLREDGHGGRCSATSRLTPIDELTQEAQRLGMYASRYSADDWRKLYAGAADSLATLSDILNNENGDVAISLSMVRDIIAERDELRRRASACTCFRRELNP